MQGAKGNTMGYLADMPGFGPKRARALRERGIETDEQLLCMLPVRYQDTTTITAIQDLEEDREAAFEGDIISGPSLHRARGMQWVSATVADGTGRMRVMFFNQPWVKQQLSGGESVTLFGRVTRKKSGLFVINPSIVHERRITPVYQAVPGVPGKLLRDTMEAILRSRVIEDDLPSEIVREYDLLDRHTALAQAHFPDDLQTLARAKYRLAFEELLYYQAAMTGLRGERKNGAVIPSQAQAPDDFWRTLPFAPTGAQRRVLSEIAQDMANEKAMARMVQGDVGCGKTYIALGALYLCARAGFQGALMAPTEILATQHLESAQKLLAPLGITCGLLTGKMTAAQKRRAHEAIAAGEWQVVIGTHALISQGVEFAHLGLVVTDEQHRFGVRQRTMLSLKGEEPNVLVMSATPIPRSLALVLYGDLDISVVDEMPPGRTPVRTRIVPEEKREGLYRFIREKAAAGEQTYVVCPLVGEGEAAEGMEELRSAVSTLEELRDGPLNGLRIGLVHGKMKAQEKDDTLEAFRAGALDVLVATTVIEVGVNVPNATVMVIEDAHRFGLAQLHQLRGRVGRGSGESWCFLLSEPNERLRTLCETNDGFVVAQKDLDARGAGEFFGTRQHGEAALPAVMLCGEAQLLERTQRLWQRLRGERESGLARRVIDAAARRFAMTGRELARN